MSNILITGGAGYIGSHTGKLLGRAGHRIVTLDNLSKGYAGAVRFGELVEGDTGDSALVSRLLKVHDIDTIMHFAAWTIVPESVAKPLMYYQNNTSNARTLMECAVQHGVRNFIFSSTAAVYGIPPDGRCTESSTNAPINPYGSSKLMAEQILRDACAASAMKHVILRYFNVAGSDPEGEIGQSTVGATLLVKVACEAATGRRQGVSVFGTDYPTRDGTGIRDYIHVCDLADAHRLAMEYLDGGGESQTLNCGYGRGFSVREVLETVERVAGKALDITYADRRAGDPPELIADSSRLTALFDWVPRYDALETIVRTSYDWECKLATGQVKDGLAQTQAWI